MKSEYKLSIIILVSLTIVIGIVAFFVSQNTDYSEKDEVVLDSIINESYDDDPIVYGNYSSLYGYFSEEETYIIFGHLDAYFLKNYPSVVSAVIDKNSLKKDTLNSLVTFNISFSKKKLIIKILVSDNGILQGVFINE